jgi:hypothetical protein
MEERPELDCIEATLQLLTTDQGGRRSAITTGYRGGLLVFPEWYDTWNDAGEHRCLGALLHLCELSELQPGESATVRLYPWAEGALELADVSPGAPFRLHEGHRLVAIGTVLRTLRERRPE